MLRKAIWLAGGAMALTAVTLIAPTPQAHADTTVISGPAILPIVINVTIIVNTNDRSPGATLNPSIPSTSYGAGGGLGGGLLGLIPGLGALIDQTAQAPDVPPPSVLVTSVTLGDPPPQ